MSGRYVVLLMGWCGVVFVAGGCFNEPTATLAFDENELSLGDDWGAEVGAGELIGSEGGEVTVAGSTGPLIGASYSFVKRVTQTLAQSSVDGLDTSQSQMDAWYDITIEGVQGRDRIYRVTYRRLKYWYRIPGEQVMFDSSEVNSNPPAAVHPYLALIRSGFAFRVNAAGQITELLEVPATLFRGPSRGPAAAEFVWDRVGLVALGTSPNNETIAPPPRIRRIESPVPMEISTRYTIKEAGSARVSLDVLGSIATGQPATTVTLAGGTVDVTLKGGHAFGELVIDRASGLPRRAHWNRYVEISLESTTGGRIEQRKHEVVTIRTAEAGLPGDAGGEPAGSSADQLPPITPSSQRPTVSGS